MQRNQYKTISHDIVVSRVTFQSLEYIFLSDDYGLRGIKTNIKSKLFGPSRGEVFRPLFNLYINEEGKRFCQTVTATTRPYVTENDDNPLFPPDLINNHEIPATMQTITLKNYSIDEIMEGKQGHTTIKTSCIRRSNTPSMFYTIISLTCVLITG